MGELETKQKVLKFTETLVKSGVKIVAVSYSGCGDEGQNDDPQFEGQDGKPIEAREVRSVLDVDALGDLLAAFVPEGYEDNEGGGGTITFDVESGKIRLEHNWYETVSHADEPREI